MKQDASLNGVLQTLRRWQRSRLQRASEWQFTPAYWKLRSKVLNAQFHLRSRKFRLKDYLSSRRESASARRALLIGVLKPTLVAIAIISLLEFVEFSVSKYGLSGERLLPALTSRWLSALDQIINLNVSTYAAFLGVFASVAGAFLALYYTAVSVVVSTVYSRVQGDVRSIVLRDKVSNAYVNLVAMLGATSAILLASIALGRLPGVLNLLFVAALGVASFYSFVQLGSRIFYFFDPTHLVGFLTADLVRWMRNATPSGYRWQEPAFQAHYQKQAAAVLTTYRNIVLLANREEHLQSEALVGLAERAFALLGFYGEGKSGIPSDSKWFRPTYFHPNWLTASSAYTFTALNTGTSLQAQVIPNLMWFESEIEETVAYTLDNLFSRKDLQSVYAFSNAAQQTLYNLAHSFAMDEAMHLFRTLAPPLREQSHSAELSDAKTTEGLLELNRALALTDMYALGFIQILLGLTTKLGKLTVDSFGTTVAELQWERVRSIYQTGLPRSVIEQMEVLRKQLYFERAVEHKLMTPIWYRQEIVAIAFIRFFERTCIELLDEFEKAIADEAESLVREKRPVFAAQLIERGLEGCNKFAYHFEAIRHYVEALSKLRKVEDIPCPSIDWESHARRIDKVRERLLGALALATPDLANLPKTDKLPDYFGHAYASISNESYTALAKGDESRFRTFFPILLSAGLSARDQLFSSSQIADQVTRFGFSLQPLLDVVEISGFAYLFSELTDKDFRGIVDRVWDAYFDAASDKEAAARLICGNLALNEWPFKSYPREEMRMSWEQDFESQLRSLGLLESMIAPSYAGDDESRHPSKLIREISGGLMLYYKPHNVFLAEYFMKRFDLSNLKLPEEAKRLYRAMNPTTQTAGR